MRTFNMAILAIATATIPHAALAQDAAQWTGPYAGLSFGHVDADIQLVTIRETFGGDGGFGGFIGYDYAVADNIVVGGELALFDTEVSPDTENGGTGILENLSAANFRIGYAKGNALFYGGIGYMVSGLESTAGIADPSNGSGISVTMGLEAFVADDVTLRADVTKATLENFESVAPGYKVETTSMRIGMAYRF